MLAILRLGHRVSRDKRATTHVFLAARAFGADRGYLSGERDDSAIAAVGRVAKNWGGGFNVEYVSDWKKFLSETKMTIVHLTMYGMPVEEKIDEIRKKKNLLVVVGGEKVPSEVYQIAAYNISVTNQPHSEVAALALFLDRFFSGSELKKPFPDAKRKIIPSERGKRFA